MQCHVPQPMCAHQSHPLWRLRQAPLRKIYGDFDRRQPSITASFHWYTATNQCPSLFGLVMVHICDHQVIAFHQPHSIYSQHSWITQVLVMRSPY